MRRGVACGPRSGEFAVCGFSLSKRCEWTVEDTPNVAMDRERR